MYNIKQEKHNDNLQLTMNFLWLSLIWLYSYQE